MSGQSRRDSEVAESDAPVPDTHPRRVLVYAPDPAVRRWVEEELAGFSCHLVPVATVGDAMTTLRDVPRGTVFIIDLESLDVDDARALQHLRDERWTGQLIVLGRLPRELRRTLRGAQRIMRPFGSEALRVLISDTTRRDSAQLLA